jgi:hypothetical protein
VIEEHERADRAAGHLRQRTPNLEPAEILPVLIEYCLQHCLLRFLFAQASFYQD